MEKITLKAARVNANMRQEDVAKRLNISTRTIANWEKGRTCPRVHDLESLCAIYGVQMSAIILSN